MDKVELQKINKLETHDRLLEYQKQADQIGIEVDKCIKGLPSGIKYPFYVWGHSRQIGMDERFSLFMSGTYVNFDEVPCEIFYWIPKPEKPCSTPNSYLFRAKQGSDVVEIIWILPKYELWGQFEPGKMTYNQDIWNSILNFKYRREELESPEPGDMDIDQRDEFREIIKECALWNKIDSPFRMI